MKRNGLIVIICFLLINAAVIAGYRLGEPLDWSKSENRELAQKPELSGFREDPEKTAAAYDSYLSDQFPLREDLVALYTKFQAESGRWYVRDVRVTRGPQPAAEPSAPAAQAQSEAPAAAAEAQPSEPEPFFIGPDYLFKDNYPLLPSHKKYYTESLGKLASFEGVTVIDAPLPHKNFALAEGTDGQIDPQVDIDNLEFRREAAEQTGTVFIDACSLFNESFSIQARARMFYKTDIHWNMLGAYRCSTLIAHQMAERGIIARSSVPAPSMFTWRDLSADHRHEGDLGRMILGDDYSIHEFIPLYTLSEPDGLEYYKSEGGAQEKRSDIIAYGINDEVLDYNKVCTRNLQYLRIENPGAPEKQSVIILKDSYQCGTVEYFSAIFSELIIMDPRYDLPDLSGLVAAHGTDLILLMYHQNSLFEEFSSYVLD